MPRHPRRATQYVAVLQGLEEEAELDCGFLIQENLENHRIELWFCTLHQTAPRMLEALELMAQVAYTWAGPPTLFSAFFVSR